MTAVRFTLAGLERANAEWGASCGPASLAAICGLTLDEVRPHFPGFTGWTNVPMMLAALRSWGGRWASIGADHGGLAWPRYGLAMVAFEGPWTATNAKRERWLKIERLKRSHWVGAWTTTSHGTGVWDINYVDNCTTRGNGWTALGEWEAHVAPSIAATYKRASGGWHIACAIEVSVVDPRVPRRTP